MEIFDSRTVAFRETRSTTSSRRQAIAMMAAGASRLFGYSAGTDAPIRLAISDSLVTDVNINDARAAMQIWIKRMVADLNVAVEINPKVFDTTEEIVRRARTSQFDSVALNVLEYRQMADLLDASQVVAETTTGQAQVQYLLVVKRSSGIQRLTDLKGRRLIALKAPRMCLAPAWLASLLDEAHLSPPEQHFGSVTTDIKVSRVILPVFFGQSDACLTSKLSFETMCEMNPQVAKDLTVIASSPGLVVTFYVFHKNYRGPGKEKFIRVYSDLPSNAAGRQLATLFQFDRLVVKDGACLAPALAIMQAADRIRGRQGAGGRKDQ